MIVALFLGCAAIDPPPPPSTAGRPVGASRCPEVVGPPDQAAFGPTWPGVSEADAVWVLTMADGAAFEVPVVHYPLRAQAWPDIVRFVNCNDAEAYTHRRSRMSVTKQRHDGACRLLEADLQWEILVSLPRWVDRRRAGADDRVKWDAWIAATSRHEEGHARIAIAAYRAHAARLSASTCDRVDEEFSALAQEHDALQLRYDACTCTGGCQDRCADPEVVQSAAGVVVGG